MIHLATCQDCDAQMDVTDCGPFSRVKCPDCGREVRVKTEMGAYHLDRRLAVGGMSVVFVARDETLGREVVVKVLSEEYSGIEKRGKQFEKEAEMTAAVSHPNVVRVYTVGRAFGRFYIAMEFVDGESLETKMDDEGALPESVVIPLALQVVDGLWAAQRAGLIHCDVKPGNILLDQKGTAKIVDFGLSLLTEGGSATADEIWATPYYVPPEALNFEEEDFRSDIYALGATLYHALAGRPPIKAKEMATATAILREEKKRVPSLLRVAPWLRPETRHAVEKAMALRRENRFSSYEEFREALELASAAVELEGEGTPIQSAAQVDRRARSVASRRAWIGAGAGALVLVACVVAFLLAKAGRDKGEGVVSGSLGKGSTMVIDRDAILDPLVAAEISQLYAGAREALVEDDFVVAERQFLAVHGHEGAPSRTAGWAGFEAVVACYLDGRPGDGREHLGMLGGFLKKEREEDTAMGKRLRGAIKMLGGLEVVSAERLPAVLEDPFRATVYFSIGLKTWEQGRFDQAAEMFEKFQSAGPWEDAEWMTVYQDLAGRYLRDMGRLTRADHEVGEKAREELREAMVGLQEIYLTLETRGRARFNVKVWQTDCVRQIRRLREAEKDPIAMRWREATEAAAELFRAGEFSQAAERLKRVELTAEKEKAKGQQMALVWLADAASVFLLEVERRFAPGNREVQIVTKGGEAFQGVIGSGPNGVMVSDGDSARLLGWDEIAPESLLAVFAGLQPDGTVGELDRLGMLESMAAYAALSGKLEKAEELAGLLAAEREGFGARWAEMMTRWRP